MRIEIEAKDNLRTHFRNLKARNPSSSYPVTWYTGIRAAIRELATSAAQCGLAYEDQYFAEPVRQRLYDAYKILFTIRENRVHVLHIRHQAQDPAEIAD